MSMPCHSVIPSSIRRCVGSGLDGTFTITAVPSTSQFRFAKTATDVPSAPVSPAGTAVRQAGYAAVTDISGAADAAFNVPGMPEYNPDLPLDFIIPSATDPEAQVV